MEGTNYYSIDEVALHNKPDDGWFVMDGVVYNATAHLKDIWCTPGKTSTVLAILRVLGTDCSEEMREINHSGKALAQIRAARMGLLQKKPRGPHGNDMVASVVSVPELNG